MHKDLHLICTILKLPWLYRTITHTKSLLIVSNDPKPNKMSLTKLKPNHYRNPSSEPSIQISSKMKNFQQRPQSHIWNNPHTPPKQFASYKKIVSQQNIYTLATCNTCTSWPRVSTKNSPIHITKTNSKHSARHKTTNYDTKKFFHTEKFYSHEPRDP